MQFKKTQLRKCGFGETKTSEKTTKIVMYN